MASNMEKFDYRGMSCFIDYEFKIYICISKRNGVRDKGKIGKLENLTNLSG